MDETSVLTVGDTSVAEGGNTCACVLENATSRAAQKKNLLLRAVLLQRYRLERSEPPSPRFSGQAALTTVILGCTMGANSFARVSARMSIHFFCKKFSAAPARRIGSASNCNPANFNSVSEKVTVLLLF